MANEITLAPEEQTEGLTEEEQESLEIGEQLAAEEQQLLAGKYENAEELEKAYIELQKKLGGEEEPVEVEEEAEEVEEEVEISPAAQVIGDASAEYAEKGELSEDMMSKFSEMSSQDLVQAYMEMQANAPQAEAAEPVELSDNDVNAIKNSVGGDVEYDKVIDWATNNLSESQIEAYDDIISTGNTDVIQMMVDGLKAKYDSANGFEGRMLTGKAANNSSDVFRSQEEVVSAIADPRYDRDPAYRNDVLEKLERSDVTFR